MKRHSTRTLVILGVVFGLLVAAPASAINATTSSYTTETELLSGTTSNLQPADRGDGALAMGVNGTTATLDSTTDTQSISAKRGLVINPNTALSGVRLTLRSQTTGATTAYLYDSSETLLATTSISGDTATLYHPLSSGTEYYVVIDAGGSTYTNAYDGTPSFPYTSTDVDISETVFEQAGSLNTGTTTAHAFSSVEAITTPASASYTGTGHGDIDQSTAWANISITNADATITWEGYDGSSWNTIESKTVSSTGNYSRGLVTTDYQDYRVDIAVTSTSNAATFALYDEGQVGPYEKPSVDNSSANPQGGATVNSDPVTLAIDVSDADFGDAEGDSVDVKFVVNGTVGGTDTLTSNGTAELSYSPDEFGTAGWYVWANDSYGHSQKSQTFTFETPSGLTLRNETNASHIITGQSITATFYGVNGQIVVEKTDSDGDGNISLSGLPNQPFVVTVESNGWHDRRVYIDSIYDQKDIYLLNSTAYSGISTTFVYEDRTGEFEQSNTTLVIERAVDPNNDSAYDWEVIAGDFWGAAGEFPFTGEYQARYRLRIVNQETGDSRLLGTHIPTDDGVKNIIVGRIRFEAGNATGRYVDATINSNTSNLQILYVDPANASTDVNIVVHEQGNSSNEIFNQTFAGPLGEKVITQSLTQNQTNTNWVVAFDVGDTADGPKFMKVVVGGGSFPLPIDGDILSAFAYVFITFVMALYGPRTALLGAWAGVFVFAGFAFLGWISGVTVAVPVLIAIGATFYNEASP